MTHTCPQCGLAHDPTLGRCPGDLEYERGYRQGYRQAHKEAQQELAKLRKSDNFHVEACAAHQQHIDELQAEIELLRSAAGIQPFLRLREAYEKAKSNHAAGGGVMYHCDRCNRDIDNPRPTKRHNWCGTCPHCGWQVYYVPSTAERDAACLEIQQNWTVSEERKRRGAVTREMEVRRVLRHHTRNNRWIPEG